MTSRKFPVFYEHLEGGRIHGISPPPDGYEGEYSSQIKEVYSLFKTIQSKTWETVSTAENYECQKLQEGNDPLATTKGITRCVGYPPEHVLAVIMTFGARSMWDTFFESGKLVEVVNRSFNLGYAAMKGIWPVSSRDTCVVSYIERKENGQILQFTKSVTHPQCKEEKGRTRAEVDIAAWMLEPYEENGIISTKLTYITRVDLKGMIPYSVLKVIATQTPLCVTRIRDYLSEHGAPPIITYLAGKILASPTFDHVSSTFEMPFTLNSNNDKFSEFYMSKQRYPTGVLVTISPNNIFDTKIYFSSVKGQEGWHVRFIANGNHDGTKVVFKVQKNPQSSILCSINGSTQPPIPFEERDITLETVESIQENDVEKIEESESESNQLEENEENEEAQNTNPFLVVPNGPPLNMKSSLSENQYSQEAKELLEYTKKLFAETPQDGWKEIPTSSGAFQILRKEIPNHPTGLLRGDITIQGYSPEMVLATIRDRNCRVIWDKELFEDHRSLQFPGYNVAIEYAKSKAQYVVSSRDFALLSTWTKESDGTLISVAKSIVRKDLAPPVSGCVRGEMTVSAWILTPKLNPLTNTIDTITTYISANNPNGFVPSSLLQLVMKEIPKGVFHVSRFLEKFGPPPALLHLAGNFKESSVNNETSEFNLSYENDPSADYPYTSILISDQRYPNGASVSISPAKFTCSLVEGVLVFLPSKDLPKGQSIQIKISKNSSGPKQCSLNGEVINEIEKKVKSANTKKVQTGSSKKAGTVDQNSISKSFFTETMGKLKQLGSQIQVLSRALEVLERNHRKNSSEKYVTVLIFVVGLFLFLKSFRE